MSKKNTIKHLVISGGGSTCIKAIGALQILEENGFFNMNNIESIYSTSGGSFIATMLALRFDWKTINDYVLLRPWHEAYQIGANQIFDAFSKKGLFDENLISIFFKPFFKAKDLSLDITLSEFFQITNIELHMFTLEINKFEIIDVSYKTHPSLRLLSAIHMTSALPILISPVCVDNNCYVDGGVVFNYPLKYCLEFVMENGGSETEILGIKNDYENMNTENVGPESTILDYMFTFINKLICTASTENLQPHITNEVRYKANLLSFYHLTNAISSSENRKELLDDGIKAAMIFIEKKQESDNGQSDNGESDNGESCDLGEESCDLGEESDEKLTSNDIL